MEETCDFLIIGGGIVGLATAMKISERFAGARIAVLEKEAELASHQTGHNSGVIHAGVYYQPGSLKAEFCRKGVVATVDFCARHRVAFEQCGKLIVATSPPEVERMEALYRRCLENGLNPERLDAKGLKAREENITGLGALFIATTGIADYPAMARAMARLIEERGGRVRTGETVTAIRESADHVHVTSAKTVYKARHLTVCGGLQADRLARIAGIETDFRIVPFRGEYYRLNRRLDKVVRHLIYPVPDPALPFLGVHLTRMIDGSVTVGPNAVLGFSREGYRKGSFDLADSADMFRFPGFWTLMRRHWRSGVGEFYNSLSKRRYLALCRKYCPSLELDDLEPYRAGIRAQAVLKDGTMVHDFMIEQTARMLHLCNAPSPAATSSLPIADHLAGMIDHRLLQRG